MPRMSSNIAAVAGLAVCSTASNASRAASTVDLSEKKFKPIELTVDERIKMRREGTAIAGSEFFQPLAPVAAQRLISGYALAE